MDKGAGRIHWDSRDHSGDGPDAQKCQSWPGYTAEVNRVSDTKELGYRVKSRAVYLAFHDIIRSDGEDRVDGSIRSTRQDLRNTLTFLPGGSSAEGWVKFKRRQSLVVAVHLNPAAEEANDFRLTELRPALYFENEPLRATLLKIQAVVERSSIEEASYAEVLGMVLLHELRAAMGARAVLPRTRGGLSPKAMHRVDEYIDANFARNISLSELSVLVDLSRFHFARAFKQATGTSAYQFILTHRVERAKEMLSRQDLSIDQVARAVGFKSPLQLGRAFRRLLGITPSAFRRQLSTKRPEDP
ncbi:helix-turn-helix domain-containing protein [Bradyrhizobium sp. Arg816]|uniref:helix-turn-helix domain-containing protein n=1 Tax=Bradyrhizobium sp. Arg816 TaxID=2998491 RepID=UPI00249DCCE6|nr:AraC family transcriptional regulator [Bradyrhizobium sp. Arg816]MDI3563938.1 AraC family transcriptional regulator [Bradyrhizobium sp. Arg816]